MLERREDLKDLRIEILDKFCIALESIPLPVLEKFPKFDSDSFKKLQDLHRHVKAKLRLVQTKFLRLQKEDEKDVSESPETPTSVSLKSTPTTCEPENYSINDYDDFNTSSSSISKKIEFQNSSNVMTELHMRDDNSIESTSIIKPLEITVTNKKSTFQLKRPVKTVLDTQVSKAIEEMWEKDQQRSKIMNSSVDSEHTKPVNDTFNSSIKTPRSDKESISIQNSTTKESPNNWINIDKPHGKTELYNFLCVLNFI